MSDVIASVKRTLQGYDRPCGVAHWCRTYRHAGRDHSRRRGADGRDDLLRLRAMMAVEYSGGSPPERILPMLWRHMKPCDADSRPHVGRRPRLTVDAVVTAAITIADTHGLRAVSMNRVAASLEVGAMTLYTYVPSKADLIDLMVDEVLLERDLLPLDEGDPNDWRVRIAHYMERTRAMYHHHPWLRHVSTVRPPIGPGMLAENEYVLASLADTGLPQHQMVAAANALIAFVNASASIEADSVQLERATGLSQDAWWQERYLLWQKHFDVERYPMMTQLWSNLDGGECDKKAEDEMTEAHDFGLQRLLDGIQSAIGDWST